MQSTTSYEKLYEIALQTRNFEITLYWQRSNYFLVLNTAIAAGFFSLKGDRSRLLFALFGLFASALWLLVCAGSKFWQSRWEERLRVVEREIYPESRFFSANWEVIRADVEASLDFSKHSSIRVFFDQLVLWKPSVTFAMMLLSMGFVAFWMLLAVFQIIRLFSPITASLSIGAPVLNSATEGPMSITTIVPVLLGLQFAAFGWRILREISLEDQRRRTWFPLPDYINILAMLAVIALCIVWPLHNGASEDLSRACTAAAAVLIGFHPVSMAAHYRLFARSGRRIYVEQGRDYPWITAQEAFFVSISVIAATAAALFAACPA